MRNKKYIGLAAAGLALASMTTLTSLPAFAEETPFVLETNAPEASDDTTDYLPNVKAITKQVMPSIVAITSQSKEKIRLWGRVYEQDSESAGSGVIIAKTKKELIIATNNHVVDGSEQLNVLFSVDTEDPEEAIVPALIKGTDSALDLAVISVKVSDIPDEVMDQICPVEIGDSSAIEVGDWSIAIGNALGYGQSVTFGIVSALDREVTVDTDHGTVSNNMIQTDAAINFGNSGGALLNAKGQLIGINSAKAASSGVEGMGYAIPIDTAKPILEDLMNQSTREKVAEEESGIMGINITDVSDEARQLYSIPAGAYVLEVNKGGAAEEAGMVKGDIITRLDKTKITSVSELLNRMEYYAAGETIEVTIQHPSESGYTESVLTLTLQPKDTASDHKAIEPDPETEELPEEDIWPDDENGFSDFFDDFFYEDYDEDDDYSEDKDNEVARYGFGYWF